MNIPYPSIRGQTPEEQITEIRRYLYQLALQLNLALEERRETDGRKV